jgi:hypothetical protein
MQTFMEYQTAQLKQTKQLKTKGELSIEAAGGSRRLKRNTHDRLAGHSRG